jgi:hypothetical protein
MAQSDLGNMYANQDYWTGQQMGMGDRQFAQGANMQANLQNYNMLNQQNQQFENQMRYLSGLGPRAQTNLATLTFDQGTALGNAALGVGNATANRMMAPKNTINDTINTVTQGVGTVKGLLD